MNKAPGNRDYWQLIWLKFKTGDRDSFEEIYNEFADHLFAYGSKITTDREMLKDSIQDLFIDLYRYNPDIKNPELLEFYLYKSLKRLIIKRLQREKRMESIHPYYNAFELRFYAETEDYDTASLNERIGLLQKALESLDYRGRELLFLKFDSGLNYNEIGELLNMKPDTVKKRVYRIIQYLRDNYSSKILDLLFMFASRN